MQWRDSIFANRFNASAGLKAGRDPASVTAYRCSHALHSWLLGF